MKVKIYQKTYNYSSSIAKQVYGYQLVDKIKPYIIIHKVKI